MDKAQSINIPPTEDRAPARPQDRVGKHSVIVCLNTGSGVSTLHSCEWNYYTEQHTLWNSRFNWINYDPNGIKIVSADESSIEADDEIAHEVTKTIEVESVASNMDDEIVGNPNQIVAELERLLNAIKAELNLFGPNDLTQQVASSLLFRQQVAASLLLLRHLDSVRRKYRELHSKYGELQKSFPNQVDLRREWGDKLDTIRTDIAENRKNVLARMRASFETGVITSTANSSTNTTPNADNAPTTSVENQSSVPKTNENVVLPDNIATNKPISEDGLAIGVGGFGWNPVEDKIQVKVPSLFFAKKSRDGLSDDTVSLDPVVHDIKAVVPKDLSLRMVASKCGSTYDYLGILAPALGRTKCALSATNKAVDGWDDVMDPSLQAKWLKEFLYIEKLKGFNLTRAKLPIDAVDCKLRVLSFGDAAGGDQNLFAHFMQGLGQWRNVADAAPKLFELPPSNEEIEFSKKINCLEDDTGLVSALALEGLDGVTEDEEICLHQVDTACDDKLSTLKSKLPAEVPLDLEYPEKVSPEDVAPDSAWFSGLLWMTMDIEDAIDDAIEEGIITPASKMHLSDEEKGDYRKGFVIESEPGIIKYGHVANERRIQAILDRAKFSASLYHIDPGEYHYCETVRSLGHALALEELESVNTTPA